MKVTSTDNKEFTPVTIQITFETQRELDLAVDFFGNLSYEEFISIANSSKSNRHVYSYDEDIFLTDSIYNEIKHK